VVHVYNTAMISKRVHLYREKQRLTRSLRAESSEEVGQRSHA